MIVRVYAVGNISVEHKSKGWLGGGQAGYNWQYGRVVAGLEADFSVTGIKGDADPLIDNAGPSSFTLSDNVKYLGTSRGRLGWLPVDIQSRSGGMIGVRATKAQNGRYDDVWLIGEGRMVFRGVIT